MRSNIKSQVEQGVLPLARNADWVDLPVELVMQQKSLLGAVNLCITQSGLEDKEIYLAPGIDAGHFSNIRKGVGHFPVNKLNDLCDLCGNEAPLIWWANSRGKGLVLLVTEAERRAAAAESRAKDAEDKLKFLTLVMQGKAVA